MNAGRATGERRKWARLPLAIPVFVRSRDGKGKEFLEFATALNVSAGGMLLAIRRLLPAVAQLRLEIPSAPVAALCLLPRASRTLRAKALRSTQPKATICWASNSLVRCCLRATRTPTPVPQTPGGRKIASAV
jgi:hypothetical protein